MLNVRCLDGADTDQFTLRNSTAPVSSGKKAAQKAITGGPSSTRHKLSNRSPTRKPKSSRGYQVMIVRAGSHEPRIDKQHPRPMPSPAMAAIRVRQSQIGDLPESLRPPIPEASPENRC